MAMKGDLHQHIAAILYKVVASIATALLVERNNVQQHQLHHQ
jgi:hypothetical protein